MSILNSTGAYFRRLRTGAEEDPVRDWLILITFFTIMFIGIIVWNVWAFDTAASGGVIGRTPDTGAPPIFNASSLDTVHALFESRAIEAARYETGVYRYTDPSL